MITQDATQRCIDRLSLLPFFPSSPGQRAALAAMLLEMCSSDDQLDFIARQYMKHYRKWEGPTELRAILCGKFKPRDGIEATSAVFFDGIPSEKESAPALLGPPQDPKRLEMVRGAIKSLPAPTKLISTSVVLTEEEERAAIDKTWQDILARDKAKTEALKPKRITLPEIPADRRITEEDIQRALAERAAKKLASAC